MCQSLRMEIEKGEILLKIHDFSGFHVSIIGLVRSYCPLRCGDIFRAHLRVVKGNGITPSVVFDGLSMSIDSSQNPLHTIERVFT